jgi:hypothetical protein
LAQILYNFSIGIFIFLIRVNDHKKRYSYQRENKPPKSSTATDFHASDGHQFLVKYIPLKSCAFRQSRPLTDESRPAVPIDCDQCGAMTGIAACCARNEAPWRQRRR